ncbi:PREDICTED: uncharacterized protein LOC106817839 [Priapulus caudatus]|uniref:Uncharacterized protein LOC106817839 n=1 Tax=Priapulus caudatus TaxID=37621 RepID=A0ABM1F0Q9_PRICU|nr:PREDICTED: uncharacterized protein LOC106817839 [Priapulus caudatus]
MHADIEGNLPSEGLQWMEATSPSYEALKRVVLDRYMMRTLPYYVRFRHTGALENFNSHVLMYAPKRLAFTYPVYQARCYLAGIDYTSHADRELRKNQTTGAPM